MTAPGEESPRRAEQPGAAQPRDGQPVGRDAARATTSLVGSAALAEFFIARLALVAGAVGDTSGRDADLQRRMDAFLEPPDSWSPPEGIATRELWIAGPHGPVPVRLYAPTRERNGPRAGLVWMHGGGFVTGTLDWGEAHAVSAELAERCDAVVMSVDYRLAVDGVRYPVPLDDVISAWTWFCRGRSELGVDGGLFIGGASAGANLAAGAAMRLRDTGQTVPDGMLLAYGVYHFPVPALSREVQGLVSCLPAMFRMDYSTHIDSFENYVGSVNGVARYAAPGNADLTGMPRAAIVVCEFDDLRASSELFSRQLEQAGVPVSLHLARGMIHGHLNWFPGPTLPEISRTLDFFVDAMTKGE